MADPRLYQIGTLASLLVYGMGWLDFDITPGRVALLLTTVLATQWVGDRLAGGPPFRLSARSALISGLSLCLLLRTNRSDLAILAAVLAIAGKLLIRVDGKHVFNPTNGGIAAMLLVSNQVWVSPGQWGSAAFFAFLLACAGSLVVTRAARSDVTYAFIACYCALLFGRSFYLGEPLAIPLHRLQSGALLLFTFFMISDPKTTPDSRAGRVVFAALVAFGAWYVQFRLFRTNGLLWSLAGCSALVPLINRLAPGLRYVWPSAPSTSFRPDVVPTFRSVQAGLKACTTYRQQGALMRRMLFGIALVSMIGWSTPAILGFCGFYVAKADTKLFNKASQVVLVRDGDRTVMTMANDFEGDPKEFAVVIPVPTLLKREQIHVGEKALVDHLDAYSAPRLVEYFDQNPCARFDSRYRAMPMSAVAETVAVRDSAKAARALGVTIEAQYTVGEYDILILSAQQSSGLETWLRQNGYRIPAGASDVIATYLRQNMRFFVARVNLGEQARLGSSYLRPLQIAYESPKFMLPIRLGMVNAKGQQDLFVYALTRNGRVETTNYRTAKLPSDMELPAYLKQGNEFAGFYKAMFARQLDVQDGHAVFLEYAWDMKWCDPCAADPLSNDELRRLGVFWGDEGANGPPNVFLSRLHVRYDNAHFPEDLVFQETGDRANFQGRYVLRHAWTGADSCAAATEYRVGLAERHAREAGQLSQLTGWNIAAIRAKMGPELPAGAQPAAWWERLWKK